MRFTNVTLYTDQLESQKAFYTSILGFECIEDKSDSFAVQVGWSKLTFHESKNAHKYHYYFLIPSNHLESSLSWLESKTDIINKHGQKIFNFDSWNAASFYFYDGSGNLAKFITKPDLENESNVDFNIDQILCVNEIGMPSDSIKEINDKLETESNSKFWKGNFERFGTNGNQEGMFLLVDKTVKTIWFPTEMKITSPGFDVYIDADGNMYDIQFKDGKIEKISKWK